MRVVRAPLHGLRQGELRAGEASYRYLCKVHRKSVGDSVSLFDPDSRLEAEARIVAIDEAEQSLLLLVGPPAAARVVAEREVRVVHALPKADKLDAIVRDATELGATALELAVSARTVVQLEGARLEKRLDRLRRVAEEAARQAGRSDVPRIESPRPLRSWFDAPSGAGLLLHPRGAVHAGRPLSALPAHQSLTVFVGPEGGFDDQECAAAAAAGIAVAHLGPFVLRTETVVAAVLGGLRLLDPQEPPR